MSTDKIRSAIRIRDEIRELLDENKRDMVRIVTDLECAVRLLQQTEAFLKDDPEFEELRESILEFLYS